MNKNQKIIVSLILMLICALAVIAFLALHIITVSNTVKVADSRISATVTEVAKRANRAEDGHYGITARDSNGREYVIDATGYMNTPFSPEDKGEECVDVPDVKKGDKVVFNLPRREGQYETFYICYENNLVGYYFNVE